MNNAAAPLVMSAGQREALTTLSWSSTAAHREVKRAKVLLLAANGVANSRIAATVGVTPVTVRSATPQLGLLLRQVPARQFRASARDPTTGRLSPLTASCSTHADSFTGSRQRRATGHQNPEPRLPIDQVLLQRHPQHLRSERCCDDRLNSPSPCGQGLARKKLQKSAPDSIMQA